MIYPSRTFRGLKKHWKLVLIALFSLSIAMALGVLSLSVSNTLLLLPPAGGQPDQLVMIYSRSPDENLGQVSYPDYEYYRRNNHVFTDMAAVPNSIGVATDFNGVSVMNRAVSDNYFSVLGIRPYLGRFFSSGDERTKDIAVLTYTCWKRLGADPNIIGKKIQANTIIGVAPPEFTGSFNGLNGDVLTSLSSSGDNSPWLDTRDARRLFMIARLKPDVSRTEAQAEMAALSAQLAAAYPKEDKDRTAIVTRATLLPPDVIDDAELIVSLLMTLVMLVLLIACANVGNLLLAVAVGRRQEAAIKLALGAQRGRLIREFMGESAIICGASAVLGYFIAAFVISRYSSIDIALPQVGSYSFGFDLRLDATVAALTLALVFIAIAATGLAPAVYASTPNLMQVLGGEIVVGGTRKNFRRNVIVVVQVAVCTVVLIGMGLCERSLYNLRHSDFGFTARNLLVMSVYDPMVKGFPEAQGKELFGRVRAALSGVPGVQSLSLTRDLPMFSGYNDVSVQLPQTSTKISVGQAIVDSDYFDTLRIRLLSGRAFDSGDRENGPPVAVINQAMADKLWPGADPTGKTFLSSDPAGQFTVVGVAANGKYGSLYESGRAVMYLPLSQHYQGGIYVVARTEGDPRLWVETIRKTVRALGVSLPLQPMTLNDWMNFSLFTERITALAVAISSALGLLLAMLGLFGAISYSVSERRKELGIRVALGAMRGHLIRMVLRETVLVTAVGVGTAILPGIVVTTLLRSQFYGVHSVEWVVLIPVSAVVIIVSVVVAYFSARPWIAVDPMEAVRHA